MQPSRLVTFAAPTSDRAVRASGQAGSLDGHMARFAFEALGIELTEGQPDTSANKANERNPEQ
jgi:hypothetical protein